MIEAGTVLAVARITITEVYDGVQGDPGVDANLLEWVEEWNSNLTMIDSNMVVTPKIFAGVKNSSNTITGVALGHFTMLARQDNGEFVVENVNGLYGFWEGLKTFSIDSSGDVTFGRNDHYIKYTASTGLIEFGAGVAMAWVGATYIDKDGIFTGTLSADTVNAVSLSAVQITSGTLSADRIAAGSITATHLDATSIKSSIINTDYINGLSCTFTKGTIGGWSIASGNITCGQIMLNSTSNRIAVYGSTSSSTSGHRVQFYYTSDTNFGFYATNSSGVCIAQLGSANQIAGWQITSSAIYKNSVYLGSDGSLYNGTKWRLANDGSGFLAGSNIVWDASGNVTFGSAVSLLWSAPISELSESIDGDVLPKLTQISSSGIYTGTLTASQITAGTISASRIDVASIKASIITADNINALTLTTSKGTIGGWNIISSAIYKNSVYLGSDGSIYNGTKWKLANDGSGYLANSNISWDASGNISFSSAVSLLWSAPISELSESIDDDVLPKLTKISSTGIYTGTLTATQVNAVAISASSITTGTLSADRIAAGSIYASKLNAASIQSDIINATYINGLSCTFTKGTVGGWSIGSDNITAGTIGGDGQMPMQLRTTSSGSGYWYSGAYKPFGVSMTWHKSNNAGHIVIGQVAASGNSVKTGFMGIQMMSWDHLEYFCLSTNYTLYGSKEVYNRIAGWAFDSSSIWKGSVYLGSDGSIYNSASKWRLANDGSGYIASGNISWDASGNVSFASSVALNWTTLINQGKLYVRGTGYNNNANRIVILNGITIINTGSRGLAVTVINRDTLTHVSTTYYDVYSDESACTTMATQLDSLSASYIVVVTSYDAIRVNATLSTALQRCGASDWTTGADRIPYALIGIPTIGKNNGIEARFYTSSTDPYAELSTTITNGVPLGVNTNGKLLTYISGTGVYTGSLTADQIVAGTLDATFIDTDAIKTRILTATNINALTLTTTKGTIGGWNISSSYIYKNTVYLGSDGSIYNGTKWRLNYDGSGYLAGGNISWDTAGGITAKNALFSNVRVEGSVRNAYVLNDSSIWIGGTPADQENFNNYDNIVAVRGSWSVSIPLPWTLENSGRRITLVNYKWNSTTTIGTMTITAPTGQYFYEDGIAKSSLNMSREYVELMGYGDDTTFFGWIVVSKLNLMTDSRYGKPVRVLAQGRVTGTSSSASITYKTFDNTTMSVTRTATGKYTIYYSSLWGLSLSAAVINLTGYGYSYNSSTAPIKASVYGVYSSYMYVNTSDDASNNDGSFFFQIINMNDWVY